MKTYPVPTTNDVKEPVIIMTNTAHKILKIIDVRHQNQWNKERQAFIRWDIDDM